VVEIKCFGDPDRDIEEFYRALGQYEMYRAALEVQNVTARLFLTIPQKSLSRKRLFGIMPAVVLT
jgi:hypothetical protein